MDARRSMKHALEATTRRVFSTRTDCLEESAAGLHGGSMNGKPISTGEQAASCYFRTTVEKPHRKALIQIDERCNLHCVHCFVSATNRGSSMPLVDVEDILVPRLS